MEVLMNKALLLSLLLPVSFSLNAVSSASIAKLGGAAVAGALSIWSGNTANEMYQEGKKAKFKAAGVYYATPYALLSITSGILAGLALKSAIDVDFDFNLKSVKIK